MLGGITTTVTQYHIRPTKVSDRKIVQDIFLDAASRFGLVDTKLASLVQDTICNYSEGLGWGFGLGAIQIDDLICVGLNPAKAADDRFGPVFDYITSELTKAFSDRLALAGESQEVDVATLPRLPLTQAHRAFAQKLLDRNRNDDNAA